MDVSSGELVPDPDALSTSFISFLGFSIMRHRMIASMMRRATAVSQVGQYPTNPISVPDTIGPNKIPEIKKTEIVEIVRDLFSASTVSAIVA